MTVGTRLQAPAGETAERLRALPGFAEVPLPELEWLVANGELRRLSVGTVIRPAEVRLEEMFVILSGRVALYVRAGGTTRKVLEAGADTVLGPMPYSRYKESPGDLVIEDEMDVVVLHKTRFPELTRECPEVTAALVRHMIDRARAFRTSQLHDERMQSLGRLASGLAHELNNPASAAARDARSLAALFADAEAAARDLAAAKLSNEQLVAIDAVRTHCSEPPSRRSALESADREDEIGDWLTDHAVELRDADALARSAVSVDTLDRLAAALPPAVLGVVLRWIASGAAAQDVCRHLEAATGRIHDLVAAVKGFTFMDRERVLEDVDIARGLADTVAMLEAKARERSVTVLLETADELPRVHGYGSELNQVWQKLIDNALDAAGGQVTITSTVRGHTVVVRVADDGPGIAEEHRSRIFDPFFTTKDVGHGTGLGLDVASRLVHLHNGNIDFTSQPGRTVFRVQIPVAGVRAAQA